MINLGKQKSLPIFLTGLCLSLILTVISFFAFTSTGRDDPHFTYWISDRIKEGSVNGYNGAPFEQTSSLLHALFIAVMSSLSGLKSPVSAKVIEAIISITILSLAYFLISTRRDPYFGVLGVFTLASMPIFAYWCWGGLETSFWILLSLIQCLSIAFFARKRSGTSLLMLLLVNIAMVFLRPESVIVLPMQAVFLVCFYKLVGRIGSRNSPFSLESFNRINILILIASSSLVAILTGFLVRFMLFGRLVPSTVLAKSLWHTSILARLKPGLSYVLFNPLGTGKLGGIALCLLLIISLVSTLQSRSIFSFSIISLAVAQLASAMIGGGDWMEMGRFLVSPIFLLILNTVLYSKGRFFTVAFLSSTLLLSALFYVLTSAQESIFRRFGMQHIGYFPILRGLSINAKAIFPGETRPVAGPSHASRLNGLACVYPFEALKAPNLRDCFFLDAISIAQHRKMLFSIHKGDKIMSYQAGMVPYYLMNEHPEARFIDPIGLGSPERTSDPSLRFKGLANGGAGLSEEVFFKFVNRFKPEFIFDLDDYRQRLVKAGYVPAVTVELASSIFPYKETFYVRRDRFRAGGRQP
jgi:hypothetical protein